MADSLFDDRYRYDYIYPRGRSGETLRAVDTQADDYPVVIKRPAPNDAPPIRAGQEVSILNERKALSQLTGHPALTELMGSGQFFVGGMPHQYIVMERAEGLIIADQVLELATQGERLPHLEMLIIIDTLLDLLQTAHKRDIVYNDVDAKHLFWDRDNYRLKVIDWGNAVFLEGDEVTPQGISRQSDIFQVGELLYFILSGGGRVEIPRDADENFRVDFGEDADNVHTRLQAIVTRAVHPNLRLRYPSIAEMRKELADYRTPLERERDSIVGRVNERLNRQLSKNELRGLLETIHPALATDPGNPPAREAEELVIDRLRDLEVSADLDAVRIYMESTNWTRAADLLHELRGKAGAQTGKLIKLLLDCTLLLIDAEIDPPPPAALDAVMLLFDEHFGRAAHILLSHDPEDDYARGLQWLMAERISARVPEILLLRPNLYRLDVVLTQLTADGLVVTEPRVLLADINRTLTTSNSGAVGLAELRDKYRLIVDQLTALSTLLENISAEHKLSERKLPLATLNQALNAAMTLADNMHVIGRQATTSPRDALAALDSSRVIDPINPAWDAITRLLNNLYELLQSYQTYVPAADGSDLAEWLKNSQRDLKPFMERLFDEMLIGMVDGLAITETVWTTYCESVIEGNRIAAITALAKATDAVGTISPTLAGWLNQLRNVVTSAHYIERHAVYGGLGRALADGWEAFDRGRLADAERLGQQATEIAHSEVDRFAANRLYRLAQIMREWVDRNTINNIDRSQTALDAVEALYLPDEINLRDGFAEQMPSKETYLKAMGKGLVELYTRSSTAANRILFANYILLGTLDGHEGRLDDAEFWRDAAINALGEYGERHVCTRTLGDFAARRRDINTATALLNEVNGPQALATLETTRKTLEENPQARLLSAGIFSLRELEAALRDWADGEFRPAGIKIENAINAINEVEQAADITLTTYRSWLMDLQANAAELHTVARQMRQIIERRPEQPDDLVREAHQRQVDVTSRILGKSYAATLRQWRDMYEDFLAIYTDRSLRRSVKINEFNELFRAMFIDRHPAYSLYRHWYELTENAPEFPAPPTDEPLPRIETDIIPETEYEGSRYVENKTETSPRTGRRFRPSPILILAGGALLVVLILLVSGIFNSGGSMPDIPVTLSDTPDPVTETAVAQLSTEAAEAITDTPTVTPSATQTLDPEHVTPTLPSGMVFETPTPLESPTPSDTPTDTDTPTPTASATQTFTPTVTDTPTATNTPTATDTPTATFTPSDTPTATLPPAGLQGQHDLLALFDRLEEYPWNSEQFSLTTTINSSYWRLGVGSADDGDVIMLTLPADLLETYYGNQAATRIRQVDATLALTTFNPSLLAEQGVFFGMLLQSEDTPDSVGTQILLGEPTVINLGRYINQTVDYVSQLSVNTAIVRIRLERDLVTGDIQVYVNDNPLGQPIAFVAPNDPILPTLFVKEGGVIISVTDWKIMLR